LDEIKINYISSILAKFLTNDKNQFQAILGSKFSNIKELNDEDYFYNSLI
tara:strand:+ start:411 stop:560 length:150 start_codon:yes stop_codon:yes gene_type:complete